ncbi:MAG TPA: hypothetical protein VK957_02390 [Lunatimonas sp.]|nr:hypothetical protein [Lunatimonas sp.]
MLSPKTGLDELKRKYRVLERNVLLLIVIPLPFFSYAYLYTTGKSRSLSIPDLPELLNYLLLILVFGGLLIQQIRFNRELKSTHRNSLTFEERFLIYVRITVDRYWILLVVGILCSAGLILFENPGFTIAYASCLIVVSLGKPTPDRIVSGLRLKNEEKDKVYEISRREDL